MGFHSRRPVKGDVFLMIGNIYGKFRTELGAFSDPPKEAQKAVEQQDRQKVP